MTLPINIFAFTKQENIDPSVTRIMNHWAQTPGKFQSMIGQYTEQFNNADQMDDPQQVLDGLEASEFTKQERLAAYYVLSLQGRMNVTHLSNLKRKEIAKSREDKKEKKDEKMKEEREMTKMVQKSKRDRKLAMKRIEISAQKLKSERNASAKRRSEAAKEESKKKDE